MYVKRGKFESAISLFDEMRKNNIATPASYTIMITLGTRVSPQLAMQYYNQQFEDGLKPNEVTYNVLIQMYGRHGMSAEVVKWYKKMKDAGEYPNYASEAAYSAAIAALTDVPE